MAEEPKMDEHTDAIDHHAEHDPNKKALEEEAGAGEQAEAENMHLADSSDLGSEEYFQTST